MRAARDGLGHCGLCTTVENPLKHFSDDDTMMRCERIGVDG
jgi:hypothetical protein